MLELIVGVFIVLSLILYALMGGADFGGGMWDLLASGPRASRQREAIAGAIGPIWEANHVWLILVIVLLFTGFPRGFAVMMTALNIPLTIMLVGIVLRGSAFVFAKYDSRAESVQRRWGLIFGVSSVITPFCQGLVLGALTTGQIRATNGHVTTGFMAGWTSLYAMGCGAFALVMFAYLAATYLTIDTRKERDLQEDFRLRALGSGLLLVPIAIVVFFASRNGAPEMYHGLTRWWAPVLLGWTIVLAAVALVALYRRRFVIARAAAVGQVAMIFVGWSLAQYPDLVTPDVTIDNAHAPEITLRLLVIALGLGAMVLLPSLAFLLRLFKGRQSGAPVTHN